jgi:hypothetical protein
MLKITRNISRKLNQFSDIYALNKNREYFPDIA